jgi:hypothetical protein
MGGSSVGGEEEEVMKGKTGAGATKHVPAAASEYERGMMDALDVLVAVVNEMHDGLRPAVMVGKADPALFFLGGVASAGQNLLGGVRAEMEKRIIRALIERRQGTPPSPPGA